MDKDVDHAEESATMTIDFRIRAGPGSSYGLQRTETYSIGSYRLIRISPPIPAYLDIELYVF